MRTRQIGMTIHQYLEQQCSKPPTRVKYWVQNHNILSVDEGCGNHPSSYSSRTIAYTGWRHVGAANWN